MSEQASRSRRHRPELVEVEIPVTSGGQLHARLWRARMPRGTLIIAHGLGEHSGNYEELAGHLTRGIASVDLLAYDFQGHGKSPGRRGVVSSYGHFVDDLYSVILFTTLARAGRPVFVLGHSNGAVVAIHALLRVPHLVAGLVLSSPALALARHASRWKVALGRLLLRYAPEFTLGVGLHHDQMTRDRSLDADRRADPLRHDRISAPLYFGMLESAELAWQKAGQIEAPSLVLIGEQDPVVDPAAIRRFCDQIGSADRTLIAYPGMRHEPFNELGRESVYDDLAGWLDRILNASRR